MASTNEFAATFALIDTDQDGFITVREFKQLLDLLGGGSVTEETASSMFGQMDGDADGRVNLDELTGYLQTSGQTPGQTPGT